MSLNAMYPQVAPEEQRRVEVFHGARAEDDEDRENHGESRSDAAPSRLSRPA